MKDLTIFRIAIHVILFLCFGIFFTIFLAFLKFDVGFSFKHIESNDSRAGALNSFHSSFNRATGVDCNPVMIIMAVAKLFSASDS